MEIHEEEIFRDKKLASQLVEDGIIKIPFLSPEEIISLNSFYTTIHPNVEPPITYDGIHMTIWHSDLDYKLKVRDGIRSIISPAFERNFINYRTLVEQFVVKRQGKDTAFHIHQDWAIVDEEKYFSINMWIPLHDVDENNGAMCMVKGSHHINHKIRGAGILFPNYTPFTEDLIPYMISMKMKAGEALVFYHRTLHGSPYNRSGGWRKAVQVSLLPKHTPLQVYFQKDSNSPLEIHHPEDDFNLHYHEIRVESCLRPPTEKAQMFIDNYTPLKIERDLILTAMHNKQ